MGGQSNDVATIVLANREGTGTIAEVLRGGLQVYGDGIVNLGFDALLVQPGVQFIAPFDPHHVEMENMPHAWPPKTARE